MEHDEVLTFETPAAFRAWLTEHHEQTAGIWIRVFKKGSGQASITYAEALDEALCFGWIDGLKRPKDEVSWLQRFTKRRAKSKWSKVNTGHVERLSAAGKMMPMGQAEIDAAKSDGRWTAAYDSFALATFPEEFLETLRKNKKAFVFFEGLSRTNRYAISYRLQTAKRPETKQRRMEQILAMLAKGETFH